MKFKSWRLPRLNRLQRNLGLSAIAVLLLIFLMHRSALYIVVRGCVADTEITGSAFPCLVVRTAQRPPDSYIVLQSPLGSADTIFVPTRRILGIEDPFLREPDAPNYFAMAWAARDIVGRGKGMEIALAVNSRYRRTQDQLHIHMGCVRPGLHKRVFELLPKLAPGEWSAVHQYPEGDKVWLLRTGRASLQEVRPIEEAARLAPAAPELREFTVIAGEAVIARSHEIYLIASRNAPSGRRGGADDFLDLGCGQPPTL